MRTDRFRNGFALIALTAMALSACDTGVYSEGERTGIPTKISEKGLFDGCKSFEGELNQGGFRSEGVANIFRFSVEDEAIVEQIKIAARNQDVVTLQYNESAWFALCGRKTNHVVKRVIYSDTELRE